MMSELCQNLWKVVPKLCQMPKIIAELCQIFYFWHNSVTFIYELFTAQVHMAYALKPKQLYTDNVIKFSNYRNIFDSVCCQIYVFYIIKILVRFLDFLKWWINSQYIIALLNGIYRTCLANNFINSILPHIWCIIVIWIVIVIIYVYNFICTEFQYLTPDKLPNVFADYWQWPKINCIENRMKIVWFWLGIEPIVFFIMWLFDLAYKDIRKKNYWESGFYWNAQFNDGKDRQLQLLLKSACIAYM